MVDEWKTISLRKTLIEKVEELIQTGQYRSISEFVSEAIRLRLEELVKTGTILAQNKNVIITKQILLLYTTKHTWAQITPQGNIRVGVTEFASKHLKGVAGVITDPLNTQIKAMEPFGVAETWMFMFDLYAPVSGKIIRINEELRESPGLINEDPYERGWMIEIAPEPTRLQEELQKLLSVKEYQQLQALEGQLA